MQSTWELEQLILQGGNGAATSIEIPWPLTSDIIVEWYNLEDIIIKVYFGAAENESVARLQYRFLTKMVSPCGPPPPAK
jgi:hypothetical protein